MFNRFLKNLQKDNQGQQNKSIQLKDIIIPLFSAMVAVFLNQLFFESNKVAESRIEIVKENYLIQRPIFNRILAFSYRYETTIATYYKVPFRHYIYKDRQTGKVLKEEDKELPAVDSTTIRIPSFVIDQNKRNKFLDDIETIKKQRDLLDHEIYICLDDIIVFIETHPFPDLTKREEIIASTWKDAKTKTDWENLLDKIRQLCIDKINAFETSSN